MIDGIDVSQVQGDPDWSTVLNSGFRFAYLKATEGPSYVDPKFLKNAKNSCMDGLYVGGYCYVRPSGDPARQATLFVRTLQAGSLVGAGCLPPAIDMETRSGMTGERTVSFYRDMITRVEDLIERKVMLYTYSYFWRQLLADVPGLKDDEFFNGRPLWHANYGPVMGPWYPKGKAPPDLDPWGDALIWQYSGNKGMKVPGVVGDCDRNFFMGDENALRALCLLDPV